MLDDLLNEFNSPELKARFSKRVNIEKLRARYLASLEKAELAIIEGKDRGRVAIRNGVVKFSDRIIAETHIAEDRFSDFMVKLRKAVESGMLDEKLTGEAEAAPLRTKRPSKPWSAERRAAHEAKQAAKKKAVQTK